jgi:hypothetical protein
MIGWKNTVRIPISSFLCKGKIISWGWMMYVRVEEYSKNSNITNSAKVNINKKMLI